MFLPQQPMGLKGELAHIQVQNIKQWTLCYKKLLKFTDLEEIEYLRS